MAAFDSNAEEHNAQCHPDTRTKLLRQIREEIHHFSNRGKAFAYDGLLGASFSFRKGEGDRGKATKLFTTIANQLVYHIPALAAFVREAIDANPGVARKALRGQFEKLIQQPLARVHHAMAMVIVIDALDENFAPKDLEIPPDWPDEQVIRALAQMTVPLFIFAATVCRFIEDSAWSDPADQLKKVLQYQMKAHGSELDKLDATYLPVLNQIIVGRTDPQRSRLLAEFRDVVGPIVLLA
ncbi:hypothetical protein B0H66DRAFT_604751 [Apodospora peruviana]|uniref:Nephrocystin 3-like N-terminal domain-containing protein n=1 Tax=Apodospora peruviana TaxID=516989 RepID=A0AAE0I0S5_9PEZI|nr:hypothetical protein B0H66DRAFT_604751 [Apodospora peruviana]